MQSMSYEFKQRFSTMGTKIGKNLRNDCIFLSHSFAVTHVNQFTYHLNCPVFPLSLR